MILRSTSSFPRPFLYFFGKRIPGWRACAAVGLFIGSLLLPTFMHVQGYSPGVGLLLVGANLLTFRLIFYYSHRYFKGVRIVLLEYLLISLVGTAVTLSLTQTPILAGLDAWILAMTPGLALGRVGCLLAGCCHGRTSTRGVCYPWLRWRGAPDHLETLPLLPIPAYEALLLFFIFGVALVHFLDPHQPGDSLMLFCSMYGIGRFGFEFLRGDSRPYKGGLSEAQWTCLGLIFAISFLWLLAGDHQAYLWPGLTVFSLIVVACLAFIERRRLGAPLLRPLNPRDASEFTAIFQKARATALQKWMANKEQVAHAGGQTQRGLKLEIFFVWQESGSLAEHYVFNGRRGPLDERTLSLATFLALTAVHQPETLDLTGQR